PIVFWAPPDADRSNTYPDRCADDLNRAEACQEMTSLPHPDGAEIELVVYPRAYHAFDVDWFQPGRDVRGHWFEYNAAATDDARDRMRSFLEKNFNRRTPVNRNGGYGATPGIDRPGVCGPARWQGRKDPSEFDLL